MKDEVKNVLYLYVKALSPDLNDMEISDLLKELNPVAYKKNSVLVKQGDVASKCYFILKGCLRLFFIDAEGNEYTSGFFIENESLTILDSYRFNKPSPYGIECIEDCFLIEGSVRDEEEMKNQNAVVGQIIQRGLEEELNKNQTEQALLRSLTPEKRYIEFLNKRPGLAARVSQYQLASYLGMKPESLSRIKRRLHFS